MATMRVNQSVSLLLLVVIFCSILPTQGVGKGATITEPNQHPQISDSIDGSLPSPSSSSANQGVAISSITPPAPPDTLEFTGAQRSTELQWNLTQSFYNQNQSSAVQVTASGGFLTQEALNFTQITVHNATVTIEDDVLWYYGIPKDIPIFMGYQIRWNSTERLDGFWMAFRTGSGGNAYYAVYAAENGTYPHAQPNVSAIIVPPTLISIPTLSSNDWVWFETDESSAILDSASTYNNTFFVSVWRTQAQTTLEILGNDDYFQGIVGQDNVDEGEAYVSTTLWDSDFLLKTEVSRKEYPEDINMRVNTYPVANSTILGAGWWDYELPSPFDMTSLQSRYYAVTSSWIDLTFDCDWIGWFKKTANANTTFQIWTDRTYTAWNVTVDANFPVSAYDQFIMVDVEPSWTVHNVTHDGLNHTDWSLWSNGGAFYVLIDSASDGEWIIHCTAFNHVADVEVRDLENNIITETNATEIVNIQGYLQETIGTNITSGDAYLYVYDSYDILNYTYSSSVQTPPGGISEFEWIINQTVHTAIVPSEYTIQIAWTNGTAAGMNSTLFTVLPMTHLKMISETPKPGTELTRTQKIVFTAKYTTHDGTPLEAATITVINDTNQEPWNSSDTTHIGDGKYVIEVDVNNAQVEVTHHITLVFNQSSYVEQNYTRSFVVITVPLFADLIEGYGCSYDSGEMQWFALPDPYINDTSLQFTINVTGADGTGVSGAHLTPTLHWSGFTKTLIGVDLWEDTKLPEHFGLYNITIDTTPIQGVSFHDGDEPYIQVLVDMLDFELALTEPLYIQPKARPCYIDVQPEFENIQLYSNWTYAVPLRVILRDNITSEDFSHGTVTAEFPVIGNITLELATPGIGFYEIPALDTSTIPSGTYLVTIRSNASDYLPSETYITLTILQKSTIRHTITINSQPPPNFGTVVQLEAWFFFEGGSSSTRQASNPLPEGTRVLLEIETTAGNLEPVILYLDIDGHFVYSFTLDREAVYEFYVTVEGSEEYSGLSRQSLEESEGNSASVSVVHPFTTFVGYLPWIGLVAAVAIGSVVGYRQFVVLPKRQDRRKRLQSISDAFSDVANLTRLLVVHKESGVCIFEPFVDESMDATLMAGFLQAISTFGVDLGQSGDLAEKGQAASELRDITYQGFKILLHDGTFVRTALVLSGDPSPQLRERLEIFTSKFEEQYKGYFDHWTGRIDQFNSASHLVEEIFVVSLRLPHRVAPRRPRGVSLSDLENRLYKIAKELTKDREYLFLGQIADTYLAAAKEDKLEVFMALFVLRQKTLLIPWKIKPSLQGELPFPETTTADTEPEDVLLPQPPSAPEDAPPEQPSEKESQENSETSPPFPPFEDQETDPE